MTAFSQRFGYRKIPDVAAHDLIRDDAPEGVRVGFLSIFEKRVGPAALRDIVCEVLRKRPDPSNWSAYPNIWGEVQELVHRAPWQNFYDIVEKAIQSLSGMERASVVDDINSLFAEEGMAWHIVNSELILRTGDVTDEVVEYATEGLAQSKRPTAATELRKAVQALSQRPEPETRDAVRFALGAMEAVARDITEDRNATLGDILKRKKQLLPATLNNAFEKIWGYSSDVARHVDETKAPTLDEAVLVVGFVAAAVAFLSRK